MSLYLLIVTIVVPDVTIFIYLLSVRDLTSIFEVPYICLLYTSDAADE